MKHVLEVYFRLIKFSNEMWNNCGRGQLLIHMQSVLVQYMASFVLGVVVGAVFISETLAGRGVIILQLRAFLYPAVCLVWWHNPLV